MAHWVRRRGGPGVRGDMRVTVHVAVAVHLTETVAVDIGEGVRVGREPRCRTPRQGQCQDE